MLPSGSYCQSSFASPDTIESVLPRQNPSRHKQCSQLPFFNNGNQLLHISQTCRIAAILDDLHCFLIIRAALQLVIPELATVLSTKQISGMVSDRILNTGILPEIRCDRLIASVCMLFLHFLRVLALSLPP